MLKIRLSRGGRKKLPFYRILVTENTSPRDSNFIEKLGTFNPLVPKDSENRIAIKKDRVEHWLSVGARPTEKLAKFFIALGVEGAEKYAPTYKPKAKGTGLKKKALKRLETEAEAKAAAIEAQKAEAEAAKAEAEAAKVAAEEAKAAEAAKTAEEETKAEEVTTEEAPVNSEDKKEEEKS
jgi:small subunit ribosomal protein S16